MTRTTALADKGITVSAGGHLNQPLGLELAPNGDIITSNAGDGNFVETTPAGKQVAVAGGDAKSGAGSLFGLAIAPGGKGLVYVDDGLEHAAHAALSYPKDASWLCGNHAAGQKVWLGKSSDQRCKNTSGPLLGFWCRPSAKNQEQGVPDGSQRHSTFAAACADWPASLLDRRDEVVLAAGSAHGACAARSTRQKTA